jgi:hypothetical protein
MRRFFLFVLLWAGIAAPAFAQTCVGASGCIATIAYGSVLQAPYCQSYANGPISWGGKSYNQYSCTWPPVSGSTQWVPTSAGCPTGYQQSGTSCIQTPTGATQSQKNAAKAAARAKAAQDGMDEAAQVAAEVKAEQVMNDWITAGKSEADSLAAATVAGRVGAIENVYSRHSAESTSMRSTCIASGEFSTACVSAQDTYYGHMTAAGVDPRSPPVFTLDTTAGKKVQYEPNSTGWDVFELDSSNRTAKYLGHTPTMNFSPTDVTEPSFGDPAPAYVNKGQPVPDPTTPPRSVLDAAANPVPVLTPAHASITYHSTTTGEIVGRVSQNPDGTTVTTGTVPNGAANQLAKALAAAGLTGGGSGGSGSGSCGGTGQPKCAVLVDETGTPTAIEDKRGLLDSITLSSLGLTVFNPIIHTFQLWTDLPVIGGSDGCVEPVDFPDWKILGVQVTINLCAVWLPFKGWLTWAIYAFTAMWGFRRVTRTLSGFSS